MSHHPPGTMSAIRIAGAVVVIALSCTSCGDAPTAHSAATIASTTEGPPSTTISAPSSSAARRVTTHPPASTQPAARTISALGDPVSLMTSSREPLVGTSAIGVGVGGVIAVATSTADGGSTLSFFRSDGVPLDTHARAADGVINALSFFPSSADLIAVSSDGTVRRWRSKGARRWVADAPQSPHDGLAIKSVAISADGATVATGGVDGYVHLLDATSGALADPTGWPVDLGGNVDALAFPNTSTGRGQPPLIAAATSTGSVYLLTPGRPPAPFVTGIGPAAHVTFSSDSSHVAVSGGTGIAWYRVAGQVDDPLSGAPEFAGSTTALATFGARGGGSTLLVAAGPDPETPTRSVIAAWSDAASSKAATFHGLAGPVVALALSPDGRIVVAADDTTALVLTVFSE